MIIMCRRYLLDLNVCMYVIIKEKYDISIRVNRMRKIESFLKS